MPVTLAALDGQASGAVQVKITDAAAKWLTIFEHPDVPDEALSPGTLRISHSEAHGFASACRSIIERVETAVSNDDGYAYPTDVGPLRCSLGALIGQCERRGAAV